MSCHGLRDEGIGPALGGVTKILTKKGLFDFIKNPAQVIESGDTRAALLRDRYKLTMPAFEWMNDSEINAILSYLHHESDLQQLEPLSLEKQSEIQGLTGKLVSPIKKSKLEIELEDVVTLPLIGSSPDLGIVTLRAHPSGDGTLFVSDQHGVIYRISNANATIFFDARKLIKDFQSGPGIATGIGSFEFHPDFLTNGLIYITHAETFKEQKADYLVSDSIKAEVQWVLGEWKMNNINDSVFTGIHRELLRLHAPTFAHGFQDIGFIPGLKKQDPEYGLLYFGFGDGGSNNIKHPELTHNLKSFLGSIMRIDPVGNNSKNKKYGIPLTNPFANEKDPLTVKEIYAYGFRNPHRLTWDGKHKNRMMATDIGEANIEELNIIVNGGDYGWPVREGSYGINTLNDLKTVLNISKGDLDLYRKPFLQYDHTEGNAISGGYIYEGELTALQNKYIFGDIVTGKLFYANIDKALTDSTIYQLSIAQNGKDVTLQEMSQTKRLHLRIAYDRFRKELYIITKADGKIRRVVKVHTRDVKK